MKREYSLKKGSHVVIQITGEIKLYIAEITKENPLEMKVMESGPFARLKYEDYIIFERETELLQKEKEGEDQKLLKEMADRGRPLISGLKSRGVTDDELHEILPIETESVAA